MNIPFPNPVEQAAAVLDACGNDLQTARNLTRENVQFASTVKDFDWWLSVLCVLMEPEGACLVN